MKRISAVISTSIVCFLFWILFTQPFDFNAMTMNREEIIAGIAVSLIVGALSSPFLLKAMHSGFLIPKGFLHFWHSYLYML